MYKTELDVGVAGAIANTENKNVISRTVQGAAGIKFGVAVVQGAADKTVRVPTTGDAKFVGVALLDRTARDLTFGGFVQNETARVLDKGVVWVEVTEAVSAGDAAAVDLATGKFNKAGAAFAGAIFDTSAASGALAQLRIK
ncbi:structural cement protein Gp24 [Psychrobacter glaciei]|uniref:structural cement protein Gp24 n=1 Tax=Psychrobacter glaciei TaxID=619771 RepID=UPI003F4863C8